jgi:hypothetical protein
MDRNFSIERNRGELLPVVLGLFAMIGLTEGGMVERLSRPLYRKAARILRSAEAAVRRLIVVMAHDIVVKPRPKRPARARLVRSRTGTFQGKNQNNGQEKKPRPPSFQLCDPEKRSDAGKVRHQRRKGPKIEPRITVIDYDPRIPWFLRGQAPVTAPVPPPVATVKDGTVSAKRLCRRIFALMGALKDLPRQAKRLALWQAKPVEERRPRRERALRFGRPPGWRNKSTHVVDDILKECNWLIRSLPEPDTS